MSDVIRHVTIRGRVQGVGFRPTVWRLAGEEQLVAFAEGQLPAAVRPALRLTDPSQAVTPGRVGGK